MTLASPAGVWTPVLAGQARIAQRGVWIVNDRGARGPYFIREIEITDGMNDRGEYIEYFTFTMQKVMPAGWHRMRPGLRSPNPRRQVNVEETFVLWLEPERLTNDPPPSLQSPT